MNDTRLLRYCPDLFAYNRRKTREVKVGGVGVGGDNPIRIQSMITSDTRDTEACVKEVLGLAEAGCEIVRITAQTVKYAKNLENIRDAVRAAGCEVPLVADIHFKPDAAMEAAKWVEKVRVNPGNFVDKKKFEVREYSDEDYAEELGRIRDEFVPLVERCKELGRSMRIGTNHGSLSDRIMNRYGDTPLGMVESALEFVRIARELNYHEIIFSMKASNPKVMIEAYRLLIARLDEEGPDWNYPIHLGVTEAGDGEDGRIKSAIGIGSLLMDGIGDTIRVSLTEDAVYEVPVAEALARPFQGREESSCCGSQQSVNAAARGNSEAELRRGSYLPHLEKAVGVYAITYRLEDSVPAGVLQRYREEKDRLKRLIDLIIEQKGAVDRENELKEARTELSSAYERIIEAELHQFRGNCHLKDPNVAAAIIENWKHFDGDRYELVAWCVMPNHVHVVVAPNEGEKLETILHSWKSYTAKAANRLLGRRGDFWQKESYDHLIRDEDDWVSQIRYVLRNPETAGLGDWEWVWSKWGGSWAEAAVGCRKDYQLRAAAGTDCGEPPQRHGGGDQLRAAAGTDCGEPPQGHGGGDQLRAAAGTDCGEPPQGHGGGDQLRAAAGTDCGEPPQGHGGGDQLRAAAGTDCGEPPQRHGGGDQLRAAAGTDCGEPPQRHGGGDQLRAAAGTDCGGPPQPLRQEATDAAATLAPSWDPFSFARRDSEVMEIGGFELGGDRTVRVVTTEAKWTALGHKIESLGDFKPEIVLEASGAVALDPRDAAAVAEVNASADPVLVTVADGIGLEPVAAFRMLASVVDARHPILLKDVLEPSDDAHKDFIDTLLTAARNIGSLLCDGIGDAVLVQGEQAPGQSLRLSYNILQAAGTRIFKTDYVACPSCGRTLFNLQTTTQKIREATGHLKGVRIAVMGCIVNGPGEMADADFGYVGGAPGKINLYVGKEAVKFNIPEDEAVERLIDLIDEHGKWIDPPQREVVEV